MNFFQRLVLYRSKEHVEFSFGYFSFFAALTTLGYLTLGYWMVGWLWQDALHVQLGADTAKFIGAFCVVHLLLAFFEYFFHRYILHRTFARWLTVFMRKHERHHGLTHVATLEHTKDEQGLVAVRNKYPILTPEQVESATFPGYALITFQGVFLPLLIFLQLLWPSLPWLFAGSVAVTWSFCLYEILHAIEHLSYEKFWKKRIEKSWLVRQLYGFHLIHHLQQMRKKTNLAIGGFFGIPLPDLLFGSYYVPSELPLPGNTVDPELFQPPKPIWIIDRLDRIVDGLDERIRRQQLRPKR